MGNTQSMPSRRLEQWNTSIEKNSSVPQKFSKSINMAKARAWCFTIYPKDEEGWDPNTFDWKDPVKNIICGLEQCPKTKKLHWQGFIYFKNPVRFNTVKETLGDNTAHIEKTRGTLKQAIEYCEKSDTAVTNTYERNTIEDLGIVDDGDKIIFYWPDRGDELRDRSDKNSLWADTLACSNFSDGWQILTENFPREVLLYGTQMRKNLEQMMLEKSVEERIPLSYQRPFANKERLEKYSICLFGEPGTGKTSFALDHFKYPLLIRHTEDLKKMTHQTDGLVFDDLSFHQRNYAQEVIHLCDLEQDSTINVKHGSVTIPKRMPRIFTCNRTFDEWVPQGCNEQEKQAIKRRCNILYVKNSLY